MIFIFFFFNDTATTEIYTLSLHDALPIFIVIIGPRSSARVFAIRDPDPRPRFTFQACSDAADESSSRRRAGTSHQLTFPSDRKSTRLNSSHLVISYAVFCLKKKKKKIYNTANKLQGLHTPKRPEIYAPLYIISPTAERSQADAIGLTYTQSQQYNIVISARR